MKIAPVLRVFCAVAELVLEITASRREAFVAEFPLVLKNHPRDAAGWVWYFKFLHR